MPTTNLLERRRERWLRSATRMLRPLFDATLDPLPPLKLLRIGIGTPPADEGDWAGQCYPATPMYPTHIIINRKEDDSHIVLRILTHELCHYATESECSAHGAAFRRSARACGLRRSKREKIFWTTPTPTLHREFDRIVAKLGPYPKDQV